MGFDWDGFVGEFIAEMSWFHRGVFIIGGLVMLVSGIRSAWIWWDERDYRRMKKKQGLSDGDVRELLEEKQSRRAWEQGRYPHIDRHWRGH
ncbi:hypothetical protein [Streptosporangium sp. NPDC048865]|uniref:hypothetical protein n=1 Tax=Streptosporangium sp. NPDC048865 TaxID=3155766 RepID=UPI003426BD37